MENKEASSVERVNIIKKITNIIRKNIIEIILILFLFILCGFFYSYYMVTPKYKSTATILLTTSNSDSIAQTDISLNNNLISTYGEILKSNTVLNEVIENLGLNMSTSELYNDIQIDEITDTQIIQVTVENESPTKAQSIANELTSVFTRKNSGYL